MNKLHGIKVTAGLITLLTISAIAVGGAAAQDKPKPAAQTEQMSGCSCCKKMMEKKNDGSMNKMPGMNHPMQTGK